MFATTDRFVRTLLLAVKTVRYRTAMVKSAHGVLRTGQCGFRDVTPGTIEASPGPGIIDSRRVPGRPVLMAEIKFFGRHRNGMIRDGVIRSVMLIMGRGRYEVSAQIGVGQAHSLR